MACESLSSDGQLAAALLAVSEHVAQAALFGAATAHRLAQMAQEQADLIDSSEPDKMVELVKRVQSLTVAANHAAETGLNLLKANKELVGADDVPTPVAIAFGVKDAKHGAED